MKKYSPDSRTTINWASGTSTEIFIYPAGGSFADRSFTFRISTATVEAEESTFTFFEGITRHLMILKGQLELTHEGRYARQLQQFDQDTFSGEWPTYAKGKVTDFNLMLKGGAKGSLTRRHMEKGEAIDPKRNADYRFVYLVSGSYALPNGKIATAGDLIHLEGDEQAAITCMEAGDMIDVSVDCNTTG